MRGSLRGVSSRVDRLAHRLVRRDDEWISRIPSMSDEELDRRLFDMTKKWGGVDRVFAEMGWASDEHPEIREIWQKHEAV